jgi:YggT family protein
MSQESRYRQESPDEVVESREVVTAPVAGRPAYSERRVSFGASPLAMWVNGIYLVLAVVEGLLAIRFVLKLLAANPQAGFAQLIYGVTDPLHAPFAGLLTNPTSASANKLEITALVAMAVYALLGWLLVKVVGMVLNRTVTRSREDFR